MRFVKIFLLLPVIAFTLQAQTQTQTKLPPIIDRELLFGPPEIAGGQLSPDGKYMSFLKVYKGTMNIWVKNADAPVGYLTGMINFG